MSSRQTHLSGNEKLFQSEHCIKINQFSKDFFLNLLTRARVTHLLTNLKKKQKELYHEDFLIYIELLFIVNN